MDQQVRQTAADLLMVIWRGIPADFKSRYRMNIWEQFENQVRSAAYTGSLAKFANSICSKMGAEIGKNDEDRQMAEAILNGGQDRALLKALREETTLIVLMVRVANQERSEQWKAAHPDLFATISLEED